MSSGKSKRERREARRRGQIISSLRRGLGLSFAEAIRNLRDLNAKHSIEILEGDLAHPDAALRFAANPPDVVRALCMADPDIYKTPAGNFIVMASPDGRDKRWMTPAEAEAWRVDAAAIDRDNPAGTNFESLVPKAKGQSA